jgi:serine/threonine protein kinase
MASLSSSPSTPPVLTIGRDELLFTENTYDEATDIETDSTDYIGKGGFGRVYRAQWRRPGQPDKQVVVKAIDIEQTITRQTFHREARMLARHCGSKPQAIQLYGTCSVGTKCFIVMEYMPHGDLERFYKSADFTAMSWPQRLRLFSSIAQVVSDLHEAAIIHRDIKPDNFLIHQEEKGGEWSVKICDLGLAKSLRQASNTTPSVGTKPIGVPGYLAPEYLSMDAHEYTTAMDVYSLGMTIWSVVFSMVPFEPYTREQVVEYVCGDGTREGRRPRSHWTKIPERWRPHMQRLIQSCWQHEPQKRPSAKQVSIWLQKAEQQESGVEAVDKLIRCIHSKWHLAEAALKAFVDNDLPLTSHQANRVLALMLYTERRTDLRDRYQLPIWGTMEGSNMNSNEFDCSSCRHVAKTRLHAILHPLVTDVELEKEFVNSGYGTGVICQQPRALSEDFDLQTEPLAIPISQASVFSQGGMRMRRPSDDEEDASAEKHQKMWVSESK